MINPSGLGKAVLDFRNARRRANLQSVYSRMRGKQEGLLSFDEVSEKINLGGPRPKYLEDIPINAIMGSVGRFVDFNRQFLPLMDSDESRWAKVMIAMEEKGLPPIEVYKVGEVYFVFDGNHRVSVARQMGSSHIEAYVSEFRSDISLEPDDDLEDVVLKAEYSELMSDTYLNQSFPELDFRVSEPGTTHEILEHILVHGYYLGFEQHREVPLQEAAVSWVERVYLPVINTIRQLGIMRDFPGRTETDLYLWLKRHQSKISEALGWSIEEGKAAANLVRQFGRTPRRIFERAWEGIRKFFTPDELEVGPPPGSWRDPDVNPRKDDRLFPAILVPVNDDPETWGSLDQAIPIALKEGSVLRGLHVVDPSQDRDVEKLKWLQDEYARRCREAGVEGSLAVEEGVVSESIIRRAAWTDAVVIRIAHVPNDAFLARLRSGLRALIQRSPRPVLAVPGVTYQIKKILLAYDGSPKSEEALFLATYVSCAWEANLVVLGKTTNPRAQRKTEERVREYLDEENIPAHYVRRLGRPWSVILDVATEENVDLIIMGGYGNNPIANLLFGSTVDQVLRLFKKPVLISR